ncbi:hypothetical protein MGN70_006441 [Eutypa lata]|nr:hypothetical protein MGN70_006441 [Eutypa lata]
MLRRSIQDCERRLDLENNSKDIALWDWLQQFLENANHFDMCLLAYRGRKGEEMKHMKKKTTGVYATQTSPEISSGFDTTRHFIGRLAHHIRAPKQVLEDLSNLENLLCAYEVCHIPQGKNIAAPKADNQTTLNGILRRMFRPSDPLLKEYERDLSTMDQRLSLQENLMGQYNNPNFIPNVHAEIRVLEHFHENSLGFAGNDRFIGCSKPACYCCQLYIQHHPLRCVKPEAHYKIYLNWGPPGLLGGAKDPQFKHQRDILNLMLPELRQEALDQLKKKAGPLPGHPDSHTGITPSEVSERRRTVHLPSLETGFASLGIDSADPSTSDNEDSRSSSPEYSSLSSVRADDFSSEQGEASSSDDSLADDLEDDSDDDSDVEGGASLG